MRRTPTTARRHRAGLLAACTIGLGGLAVPSLHAAADAPSPPPSTVVSIAPIHSLVAGVMAGVGEPVLLVKGGASPHTYTLKPSDAAALAGAQIVFRVGPGLETFLDHPLETLAGQADVVDLADAPGLTLMPLREGGLWAPHDHGHEAAADADHAEPAGADHDHDHAEGESHAAEADHQHAGEATEASDEDHDHAAAAPTADHDHDHAAAHTDADAHGNEADGNEADGHEHADAHGHDAHAHDAHAQDAHGHEAAGHDHAHGHADEHDMHLWLDPRNAAAMTRAIVATLSDADPANADRYAANGAALEARLAALDQRLAGELAPVREKPFIVFHDAYQYFDARYDLDAVGTITVSPDRAPGAARIQEIRDILAERGAVCVFTEPQFEPRVVTRLVEDTGVRTGVLDPDAAAGHTPGPELYFELMTDLSKSLVDCLAGPN
jgi:zinc transport system substrate-binding protein